MNKYLACWVKLNLTCFIIVSSVHVYGSDKENPSKTFGSFGKGFEKYITALYSLESASARPAGHAHHQAALLFLYNNGFSEVQARQQMQDFAKGCTTAQDFFTNFKKYQMQESEKQLAAQRDREVKEAQRLAEEQKAARRRAQEHERRLDEEVASYTWFYPWCKNL